MLLHVSILTPPSGSTYCSLLKLHVKIVNMSLYISVMWQHIVCLCMCCFQCREVCRLVPPCTENNAHTNTRWAHYIIWYGPSIIILLITRYTNTCIVNNYLWIYCHIADKYNDIFIILTRNFSKEQYVLPEGGVSIETCRSILSVLV